MRHPALVLRCVDTAGAPVRVTLDKSAGGVGFTLEGGKGSLNGDRPLLINRIFSGKLGLDLESVTAAWSLQSVSNGI